MWCEVCVCLCLYSCSPFSRAASPMCLCSMLSLSLTDGHTITPSTSQIPSWCCAPPPYRQDVHVWPLSCFWPDVYPSHNEPKITRPLPFGASILSTAAFLDASMSGGQNIACRKNILARCEWWNEWDLSLLRDVWVTPGHRHTYFIISMWQEDKNWKHNKNKFWCGWKK